jgi:hypothetical protein
VGTHAIQVGTALGARVAITAGDDERLERARQLGAEITVNYREQDFVEVIKAETGGAHVILDVMGASYLDRNINALATGGRLVIIGMQGGRKAELNIAKLLGKRASVTATSLRARPLEEKRAIVTEVRERLWPLVEQGTVMPVIDQVVPLAEAADAHRAMERGGVFGKILLAAGAFFYDLKAPEHPVAFAGLVVLAGAATFGIGMLIASLARTETTAVVLANLVYFPMIFLTGATVPREILRLALPALGALIAEPLFLLADSAIVGHLGVDELAGVGLAQFGGQPFHLGPAPLLLDEEVADTHDEGHSREERQAGQQCGAGGGCRTGAVQRQQRIFRPLGPRGGREGQAGQLGAVRLPSRMSWRRGDVAGRLAAGAAERQQRHEDRDRNQQPQELRVLELDRRGRVPDLAHQACPRRT